MAIEPVSTATLSGAPRGRPEPSAFAAAQAAEREASPRLLEQAVGAAPRGGETGDRGSRSRLAFDDELSRTFVEIFDEDSGEVISRFPPEKIVRHIKQLIEDGKIPGATAESGLLVDRVV